MLHCGPSRQRNSPSRCCTHLHLPVHRLLQQDLGDNGRRAAREIGYGCWDTVQGLGLTCAARRAQFSWLGLGERVSREGCTPLPTPHGLSTAHRECITWSTQGIGSTFFCLYHFKMPFLACKILEPQGHLRGGVGGLGAHPHPITPLVRLQHAAMACRCTTLPGIQVPAQHVLQAWCCDADLL